MSSLLPPEARGQKTLVLEGWWEMHFFFPETTKQQWSFDQLHCSHQSSYRLFKQSFLNTHVRASEALSEFITFSFFFKSVWNDLKPTNYFITKVTFTESDSDWTVWTRCFLFWLNNKHMKAAKDETKFNKKKLILSQNSEKNFCKNSKFKRLDSELVVFSTHCDRPPLCSLMKSSCSSQVRASAVDVTLKFTVCTQDTFPLFVLHLSFLCVLGFCPEARSVLQSRLSSFNPPKLTFSTLH